MSVDMKTKLKLAPALARRKPVRGGLVLANADRRSALSPRRHSQHSGGRGRRSGIGAAAFEANKRRENVQQQQGCAVESP